MSRAASRIEADWDELPFREKVQTICAHADELLVEDIMTRLLVLGTSINIYPIARRYLLERVIARLMGCDSSRLGKLKGHFWKWVDMLTDLSFIEARYIEDMSRSLDDIVYSDSSS